MSWLRMFVDSAYLVWMLDFVIGCPTDILPLSKSENSTSRATVY